MNLLTPPPEKRNVTSRMQKIIEEMTDSCESDPIERHSSNLEAFLQRTKAAFKDSNNLLSALPEASMNGSSSESASLGNESS